MTQTQKELMGAMVGLARATENNADKLTEETAKLMLDGLQMIYTGTEEEMQAHTQAVRREKYRIVPDCSTCKSPCGRTFDYDFALMKQDEAEVISLKHLLIKALCGLAMFQKLGGYRINENYLYKSIYAIGGMDWPVDFMLDVVMEIKPFALGVLLSCRDRTTAIKLAGDSCKSGYAVANGVTIKLECTPDDYYRAVTMATVAKQAGQSTTFYLNWDNPLHTCLLLALCQMEMNCHFEMTGDGFLTENLKAYFEENYNIVSL